MSELLKIALIQGPLYWEDTQANLRMFESRLKDIPSDTGLIILPEMFNSGFTMNAANVAEGMNGNSVNWLRETAFEMQMAICGSLVIEEDQKFYNRLIFAEPSGKISYYNKRHTFTLAGEDKVYTAGDTKIVIDYMGWKICPLICYDLRFPVWSRNTEGYDLLLYVANWPETRVNAWDALLQARAIENMCYCAGVNITGTDGNGYKYTGHSSVYDVLGNRLTFSETEGIQYAILNRTDIVKLREKLRFLDDRDNFNLK